VAYQAGGDVRLLRELIAHAKTEFYDVLFWAEDSRLETERPRRTRNFTGSLASPPNARTIEAGAKDRLPADVKRFLSGRK
jgi:hypothetical protein